MTGCVYQTLLKSPVQLGFTSGPSQERNVQPELYLSINGRRILMIIKTKNNNNINSSQMVWTYTDNLNLIQVRNLVIFFFILVSTVRHARSEGMY